MILLDLQPSVKYRGFRGSETARVTSIYPSLLYGLSTCPLLLALIGTDRPPADPWVSTSYKSKRHRTDALVHVGTVTPLK